MSVERFHIEVLCQAIVYDGDGNRVSETIGGTTTKYLVDDKNPTGYSQVMDEIVNGAVTRTYTYGRQLISENQLVGSTWTPSFYGYDGHGNARFLANAAGTITDTYTFDAFGAPIASSGTTPNSYLYSGERFDSNLNLYHLRERYYNALTGRFETMDPTAGRILDPGTLHKYVYSQNDPVNRIDPTGKDAEEAASIYETVVMPVVHFLNNPILKDFLYLEGGACLAFQVYREFQPSPDDPRTAFANTFCYVAEGLALVGQLPQLGKQ